MGNSTLSAPNVISLIEVQANTVGFCSIKQSLSFRSGAAYSHAENNIRKLVELCGLPFLPTPMAKGVVPDNHPNCVAAARSM